jgi:flagellar assembly factor FliW
MKVETSRFGTIEVAEDRVIEFSKGLLGFSKYRKYVLIQPSDDGYFFWLQSMDAPELAFVVTDPALFVNDYQVPMNSSQLESMGLRSSDEAQVLVIVNKRGSVLTGNLQGPLVVHMEKKMGEQLVLADRRFHTRVPLLDMDSSAKAASA